MPPKNTNELILVVDDDQVIRWTLREALQSWGFATVETETAADAVKQFHTELLVAALLDIDLPDGSGLDVLREIKREHPEAIETRQLRRDTRKLLFVFLGRRIQAHLQFAVSEIDLTYVKPWRTFAVIADLIKLSALLMLSGCVCGIS